MIGPIEEATKAAGVALGDVPRAEGKWVDFLEKTCNFLNLASSHALYRIMRDK